MPRAAIKQTYTLIQQKIAALTAQAEKMKVAEKGEVVRKIKEAIAVYDITVDDLFGGRKSKATEPATAKERAAAKVKGATPSRKATAAGTIGRVYPKVKAKYKDEAGNTWSGRGSKPRWLSEAIAAGKNLEDFSI